MKNKQIYINEIIMEFMKVHNSLNEVERGVIINYIKTLTYPRLEINANGNLELKDTLLSDRLEGGN